jgi:hypothetical protein
LETFKPDFTPYQDAPQIKQNLVNSYVGEIDTLEDIQYDENDNIIAIIKNGKRLEDEHGNPVTFTGYNKTRASNYFKFLKQDAKGGAGNKNDPGNHSNTSSVYKTKEELLNAYEEMKRTGAKPEELAAMIKQHEHIAR